MADTEGVDYAITVTQRYCSAILIIVLDLAHSTPTSIKIFVGHKKYSPWKAQHPSQELCIPQKQVSNS